MDCLNLQYYPKLKKPVLLAAWPGVSNVALEVAIYLRDKLAAEEFADIDPLDFYSPLGILVHNNVVQVPVFPESKFYFARTPKGKSDLVIFIGDAQPDRNQYEMAHAIIDAAQKLKVKRIYTCAAALVNHSVEKSQVWAAATSSRLVKDLRDYDITLTGDFQIRGLNGLLLGVARERGLGAVCLLGETAKYASELPNPIASYAVLGVLTKLLGIEMDLSDIAQEAKQMGEVMRTLSREVMAKYIDHFTQPIWEQNPSAEDEEDE
ncbi:MAG: PAC2 family protein [Dehalococcoidia bacterium]|nr:PAC2 family protein [Dehalococcoidia bacterium]